MGGYTFLQIPLRFLLELAVSPSCLKPQFRLRRDREIILQFVSAFCSSWFGLGLLNGLQVDQTRSESSSKIFNERPLTSQRVNAQERPFTQPALVAGRSIDMTLFAVSRAAETIIHKVWLRRKSARLIKGQWTAFESAVSRYADSWLFATSAGSVMWAWFYTPERLPPAYRAWIRSAADVDDRLVQVLRKAREGQFVYGKDTGQSSILQSMCKDYNWPLLWGDPAKTVPIPCEMVHMGYGPSCHLHAALRFFKAFRFALIMYLPLQLLIRVRKPSFAPLRKACMEAARSAAFLGAFVSLFYYGVCLSRTQVGPKILSPKIVTPMMWDAGLCVRAGCLLCGWSILFEAEKRRQELAMFVVPRAAATLFPRKYQRKVRKLKPRYLVIALTEEEGLLERKDSFLPKHCDPIHLRP